MALAQQISIQNIRLRAGAGVNTAVSPLDINDAECSVGENFSLQLGDNRFVRRSAFDLAGTAPNAQAVRGFAQVEKADGTLSTLVQAGSAVYEWDGLSTFTLVGSVASGARIRGPAAHFWPLTTPTVIVTDLAQVQPVMQWDGTTFKKMAHNLAGEFYARYCTVAGEAAWYGNIKTTTTTPHLLVRSALQDFDQISVSTKGGSAAAADPFYLPMPDLKYINGLASAFGLIVISTKRGQIYKITGVDGTDMAVGELHPQSGASGDEPTVYIGNDFAYGRPGRIETMFATEKLGDVAVDDLSEQIAPDIRDLQNWDIYYLSRFQRVYCFSPFHNKVYVLHKDFVDIDIRRVAERKEGARLSPWAIWTTDHDFSFQPAAVMVMRDPRDGLENVFMGGNAGEIFRLEGTGGQDGGTTDITAFRTSKTFSLGVDTVFDVNGYLSYRKTNAGTVTITFEHGGFNIFDQSITLTIEGPTNAPTWGGDYYFGGDVYWGIPFEKRLTRQKAHAAGISSEFGVKISVSGANDFYIEELFVQFTAV